MEFCLISVDTQSHRIIFTVLQKSPMLIHKGLLNDIEVGRWCARSETRNPGAINWHWYVRHILTPFFEYPRRVCALFRQCFSWQNSEQVIAASVLTISWHWYVRHILTPFFEYPRTVCALFRQCFSWQNSEQVIVASIFTINWRRYVRFIPTPFFEYPRTVFCALFRQCFSWQNSKQGIAASIFTRSEY